jgi:hypothetical protein
MLHANLFAKIRYFTLTRVKISRGQQVLTQFEANQVVLPTQQHYWANIFNGQFVRDANFHGTHEIDLLVEMSEPRIDCSLLQMALNIHIDLL